MKFRYLLLLVTPFILSASEAAGHEGGTDIVARTINFLIFAAILYFLIADKIKAFFTGRTASIANQLTEIQDKLEASKAQKESALKEAQEAKDKAKDLVEVAKKEAELISQKIASDAKNEIEHMQRALKERMEIEEKKMTKSVVTEVIEDVKIELNNDDFLNIIKKKVA